MYHVQANFVSPLSSPLTSLISLQYTESVFWLVFFIPVYLQYSRWYSPGAYESGLLSNLWGCEQVCLIVCETRMLSAVSREGCSVTCGSGFLRDLWVRFAQWPVSSFTTCEQVCSVLWVRFAQRGQACLISDMWADLPSYLWEDVLSDLWLRIAQWPMSRFAQWPERWFDQWPMCAKFTQWHVRFFAQWYVSGDCSVTSGTGLLSY